MDKKLTIKESFNLGKGWNLMIFAILAMLVTNAGVNDGLNIALPEIAKGAGLDYELCLSMGTVAGFVGVAMMLVIAKFRDRFGGRKVSAALFIIFGFTFYFLFLRASNIVMYAISQCIMVSCGQGCFYLCTGPMQSDWFPKKRGVVNGISTIGANIGTAILAPIMTTLLTMAEYKTTKRDIALIGTVLMLIGGLMPQVLNSKLWMLYAASIVIGAGLSLVVVVSSSLISDYFTGLEKSRVMGFQSIFVSIGGTIIAKGSGLFTAMAGWKRGYLVFLICIPILLIVALTVPKGEVVAKEEKASGGISGSMIYFGALCLITGVFVATFNTNIAMYIDRKGIGDASTAGTVASIMQVIGILGGLVLGNTVKLFKRFTIGAAILMMAVGTAMVGFSTNLPVICVGAAVVGFGFAIRNPGAVTFAANMVPAAQASLAIAIVSATYNVGNFISAYVVNPLANMLGNDISNRFILSAVALAVIGIVACVKAPTTDAQKRLDSAHITCNKNAIPNDPRSPFLTSGVRLGTPAVTTRGMKEEDMEVIAEAISLVIKDEANVEKAKTLVAGLTEKYPLI